MDTTSVGFGITVAFVSLIAGALTWLFRPSLRRSRLLSSVLAMSIFVLTVGLGIILMLFVTLSEMPDMRDF